MLGRKNNQIWFKRIRGSYLPKNNTGLAIYLAYLAYLIALVVAWYIDERSVWELVVSVIPLSIAAAVLTQFIASKHSK